MWSGTVTISSVSFMAIYSASNVWTLDTVHMSRFADRKIPKQMLDLWFGGPYGLGFQDNSIVKVCALNWGHSNIIVQETRKFALKTFHEIGFNSATVEVYSHQCLMKTIIYYIRTLSTITLSKSSLGGVNQTEHLLMYPRTSRWNPVQNIFEMQTVISIWSIRVQKAIGNVVWRITFGIDLHFDNELLPKYRKIQLEVEHLRISCMEIFAHKLVYS